MKKFLFLFLLICTINANAAKRLLVVTQKCLTTVKTINRDAQELIKEMNWHFNQVKRHGWSSRPSEVIQQHGTQPTRIDELGLRHMPATQYVAKFITPMAEQLDKDFENKHAELGGDRQKTWLWFKEHFTQQASKAFGPYKRELVRQDQEELAAADRQNKEKK